MFRCLWSPAFDIRRVVAELTSLFGDTLGLPLTSNDEAKLASLFLLRKEGGLFRGQVFGLPCNLAATVEVFKMDLCVYNGMPVECQVLTTNNGVRIDNVFRTLASYDVCAGNTLVLAFSSVARHLSVRQRKAARLFLRVLRNLLIL
jgi:hypothetical protein